ncbi:MAG: hypothetical protein VB099_12795 [Candidatus Limiplasma sp.]|nr:hypothetical protein [Candidatus Limiplasma sp.]
MKKWISAFLVALMMIVLVAGAAAQSAAEPEGKPLYARQIAEGSYAITVKSSTSMFRVVDAQLTVEDGAMSCLITMSGKGFGKLYLGTGEEALADTEENTIPSVINGEGAVTFLVPVEALDMEIECTGWSIRKKKWYDRTLVFESALIPPEAVTAE